MNSLLEFEHLEDHQACPAGAAKGLSMEGLMKEVGCIHVDCGACMCSEVQSLVWPCHLLWSQHCKLRRKGIQGGLLLHWHRQLYCCMRQVEERYRVEEPEWVRKQSIAFGMK